jgi:tetratricopeptide (TPR) repeat protein
LVGIALILLCAGMTYLSAGRIDEAASHAREALALTRRLGARGSEAYALCLAGDVALTGDAEDADGYYREALAIAESLGMARSSPTATSAWASSTRTRTSVSRRRSISARR